MLRVLNIVAAALGVITVLTSLYADAIMAEDVYRLESAELASCITNVVQYKDSKSAAKIARYYSNYQAMDEVGNVWLYLAAQLGDKYSELCLFTARLRRERIFTSKALQECRKCKFPKLILEYVEMQRDGLVRGCDAVKENSLFELADVAEFKEFYVDSKFLFKLDKSSRLGVVYRKPRTRKSVPSGYMISALPPGGCLPGEWLSVLERFGDEADKNNLLLINMYWYGEDHSAEEVRYWASAAIERLSTEDKILLKDIKGKLLLEGDKWMDLNNVLHDLLDIEPVNKQGVDSEVNVKGKL